MVGLDIYINIYIGKLLEYIYIYIYIKERDAFLKSFEKKKLILFDL
jgi:hypothetical protein